MEYPQLYNNHILFVVGGIGDRLGRPFLAGRDPVFLLR